MDLWCSMYSILKKYKKISYIHRVFERTLYRILPRLRWHLSPDTALEVLALDLENLAVLALGFLERQTRSVR